MSKTLKILIGIGIILLAVISLNRSGGILCAMLLIALDSTSVIAKASMEFHDYKGIRRDTNPLYVKGCYRKKIKNNTLIKWSDLKLFYWLEIYLLVQNILFLISGFITDITGEWYIIQGLMPVAAVLPFPISSCIISYYERILKKGLKKPKKQLIWEPFESKSDYHYKHQVPYSLETAYRRFDRLEVNLSCVLHQQNFVLWKKYLSDFLGEVYMYFKQDEHSFKLFMLINSQKIESERYNLDYSELTSGTEIPADVRDTLLSQGNTIDHIDSMLENFFTEYFGNLKPKNEIYLTVLICAESMSYNWNMVISEIKQTHGRYWLPSVISFDTGVLYIAKQKNKYGLVEFEKMRQELLDLLHLSS